MRAGSAAQMLLAWEDPERMHRGLQNAAFSAAALSGIRRRGWAQSVGEREQGVASVSAPVRSPGGKIIAAVSVSGPLERLSRQPGRMHAPAVLAAAERLSESLRRALPRSSSGRLFAHRVSRRVTRPSQARFESTLLNLPSCFDPTWCLGSAQKRASWLDLEQRLACARCRRRTRSACRWRR